MKYLCLLLVLSYSFSASAQYNFEVITHIDDTQIKNQGNTGTCWSFAATSFLESEVLRKQEKELNFSEMHIVRQVYHDKAYNYIMRQGKANFSEGALAHDLFNAAKKVGMVPEDSYVGTKGKKHDHAEMFDELQAYLDTLLTNKKEIKDWKGGYDDILDEYLGTSVAEVIQNENQISSLQYFDEFDVDLGDLINITSFTHHPFYTNFILEIPDNFSNGSYYNVPIEELEAITKKALNEGHTVLWDGDVSEKGFSAKKGLAIIPEEMNEDCFTEPCEEVMQTQEDRQTCFENFTTTDDHLMHIVGLSKDESGDMYYIIKNSWGEISDYKGYLMMSEPYFRAKTVAITLDKKFLEQVDNE